MYCSLVENLLQINRKLFLKPLWLLVSVRQPLGESKTPSWRCPWALAPGSQPSPLIRWSQVKHSLARASGAHQAQSTKVVCKLEGIFPGHKSPLCHLWLMHSPCHLLPGLCQCSLSVAVFLVPPEQLGLSSCPFGFCLYP